MLAEASDALSSPLPMVSGEGPPASALCRRLRRFPALYVEGERLLRVQVRAVQPRRAEGAPPKAVGDSGSVRWGRVSGVWSEGGAAGQCRR